MKSKVAYDIALVQAETVKSTLTPYCGRIEIAGSIRRKKPEVGDIEIVAVPKIFFGVNLFMEKISEDSALDLFKWVLLGKTINNGSRYKQIELETGLPLDLFIVLPPAQWGVIFMIRTGSAEFSKSMVTPRAYGGKLPNCYRVKDGAVWMGETMIETPEEADYFKLCDMDFVPPEKR